MLRLSNLLLLSMIASQSVAQGADIGMTSIEGQGHDLARPFLWKSTSGDFSLGLGIEQSKGFDLDTENHDNEAQVSSLDLSYRLPWNLEAGATFSSKQEKLGDQSQNLPLSASGSLRLHLWEGATYRTSLGGQFEAGTKKENSFHQVGVPRRSLFVSQEYSFFSWLHSGAYFNKSWRGPEYFGEWRLGDELSFGARLTLGSPLIHAFGEAGARQLVVKYKDQDQCSQDGNLWRVGLGSQLDSFDLSVSALIGGSQAFFGLARESFLASIHYNIRSKRSLIAAASTVKPQSKLQTIKAADSKESLKPEGLASPTESDEADDFELLEKKREIEARDLNKPVPSEIAERELKALREARDKELKREKNQEKERQERYDEAVRDEVSQDNKVIRRYKSDIDAELNEYTLPDSEEINWNGLRK